MRVGGVGRSKQIIKQKQRLGKVKQHTAQKRFNASEFSDFIRARWYLTQHSKLSKIQWAVSEHYLLQVINELVKIQHNELTHVDLKTILANAMPTNGQLAWQYYKCLLTKLPLLQKFIIKELQVNQYFVVATAATEDDYYRLIANGVAANLSVAQVNSLKLATQYYDMIKQATKINWQLVTELYRGIEVIGQKSLNEVLVRPANLGASEQLQISKIKALVGQQLMTALLPLLPTDRPRWTLTELVLAISSSSFTLNWAADVTQLVGLSNQIKTFIKVNQIEATQFKEADWQILEEILEQVGLNKFLVVIE